MGARIGGQVGLNGGANERAGPPTLYVKKRPGTAQIRNASIVCRHIVGGVKFGTNVSDVNVLGKKSLTFLGIILHVRTHSCVRACVPAWS